MTNSNAKIDLAKMPYIGRVVTNIDTGRGAAEGGLKSFDDVRAKQYTVGASGGGSTTVLFPTALQTYAGAKFKLVRGYSGSKRYPARHGTRRGGYRRRLRVPGILVSHPG